MTTNYDTISEEYNRAKQQPWRLHVELFTMFELLGDLTGKSVLDLACGEGFFTRALQLKGAARVVGADLSERMVELGRKQEASNPLGVEYIHSDAKKLNLAEKFDQVVAGYLLNYASNREELLEMCQAIARHLKPGGRFVTVNNNPAPPRDPRASYKKYGFERIIHGEFRDGTPITWRIFLEKDSFDITNYQLSVATHEWAFAGAGLEDVRWHQPRLAATDNRRQPADNR